MTSHILQALGFLAATIILWCAEPLLNLMTASCRFILRVSLWLLIVGAVSILFCICQGYVPQPAVVLTLLGMALLLVSERRAKALLRAHHIERRVRQ